ncbi:hypothetical protein BpHYR1_038012 [Brachionus plicatilis]|uniref:Chromo domain-containing protein n=1 Tax=Brachionus plicatilis TaxID=10195 RepID=A0A3M7PES7_BRAPC|nr:hypothetical protein BpHYR1_038012 [Brachionus plicatilis]
MNSIRSWEIRNGEDDESALIRRTAEIQKLQEEIIPNAVQNLHKAQNKQATTQNKQKNVSYNFLKPNDQVFIKSEKIQDKFKPIFDSPYIIKSQTNYGNYVLTNLKGDELKDSYPRWRLKLTEQFDKNKEIDNLQDIDKIEKILDHRKIGRGYKYLIKWKGSLVDKSLRDDYLNTLKINKRKTTKTKPQKSNHSDLIKN